MVQQQLQSNKCKLLSLFGVNVIKGQEWCASYCDCSNTRKQLSALKRFGIELPPLPEDADLLEWVKEKIESGEIKVQKRKCGNCRNILIGFAKLARIKLTGDEPPEFAIERIDICQKCEHRTWLNPIEWGVRAMKKRDRVQGRQLPVDHNRDPFDVLWCSLCRCCIMAAALVPEKECLAKKWPEIKDEQ